MLIAIKWANNIVNAGRSTNKILKLDPIVIEIYLEAINGHYWPFLWLSYRGDGLSESKRSSENHPFDHSPHSSWNLIKGSGDFIEKYPIVKSAYQGTNQAVANILCRVRNPSFSSNFYEKQRMLLVHTEVAIILSSVRP